MDTKARILALVADVLEIDTAEVREESHFFQDLGASSLDIAELIWRIEDDPSWGIGEIPDSDLVDMTKVGDVVRYIDSRRTVLEPHAGSVDVAIASDHNGTTLKAELRRHMEAMGLTVRDLGVDSHLEPVDFPEYAEAVAHLVVDGRAGRGVLIGETGVGMAIAANKIDGVRAAAVSVPHTAMLARQHYDANILCLGAPLLGERIARLCVDGFLSTPFESGSDGHHLRQLKEIEEMEMRRSSRK
jgi:acyl carrier protein